MAKTTGNKDAGGMGSGAGGGAAGAGSGPGGDRTGPNGPGGGGNGGGGFGPGGKSVADMDPKSFGSTVGGMGTDQYGGVGTVAGDSDTEQDRVDVRNSLSPENQDKVSEAYRDFKGYNDSLLDKIGNFIAAAFGFSELDPTNPAAPNPVGPKSPSVTGKASWAVDPLGLALGIGGFANPMIGLAGWAYNGMKAITGYTGPQIALDGGVSQPSSPSAVDTGTSRPSAGVGVDRGGNRPTAIPFQPQAPVTPGPEAPPAPVDPIASLLEPTGRGRTNQPLVVL